MIEAKRSPNVSVVLPTYNRAETLGRAIGSVLNQTYTDFELIVVDDGSDDGTLEILSDIRDHRLLVCSNRENRGAAYARNLGIQMSRGRLIAFQDSDDEWLPHKLETQVRTFDAGEASMPDLGVVYSAFTLGKGRKVQKIRAPAEPADHPFHQVLLAGNFITTQAALVKKACFDRCGLFDIALPCLLDWDLWLRISQQYAFLAIDQVLVVLQQTPGSISRDPGQLALAFETILEKNTASLDAHPSILAKHIYTIGNLHIVSGNHRKGQTYLNKARTLEPHTLRYHLAYAISWIGSTVYRWIFGLKHFLRPGWL